MEWTKEKLEKLQEQINKKYQEQINKKYNGGYEYPHDDKIWHDTLKAFGIDVRRDAFSPRCRPERSVVPRKGSMSGWGPYIHDDGNVCLIDPFNSYDMLVVSQETAERILIMGL